eukprot:scaffold1884_cov343-Ochromonas_danica.AAC.35
MKATTVVLPPIRQKKKAAPAKQSSSTKPSPGVHDSSITMIDRPAPARTSSASLPAPSRSALEEALYQLSLPARLDDGSSGKVRIRYSHYQKLFPVHNGVLKWEDVDNEYSFSFVFKGRYQRRLVFVSSHPTNPKLPPIIQLNVSHDAILRSGMLSDMDKVADRDEDGNYFINLKDNDDLLAVIEEDPVAGVGIDGLTLIKEPLQAVQLSALSGKVVAGEDRKGLTESMHLITKELKALSPNELQSDLAKDLIERRDLEDVLFAST